MWYTNENGNSVKPSALDQDSSKKFVYVRKDFEEVPESGEGDQKIPAHWKWLETKIPKEDWMIYEQVLENADDVETLSGAIAELAEISGGGE